MTIILDYEISEKWDREATGLDLRAADELALRYECFLGDVVFEVGDADFSARWGWIPVLDFAMSLRAVAGNLIDQAGRTDTFEFTESDAEIRFRREGPIVEIETSYVPVRAQVSPSDLSVQTERFLSRVIRDLNGRYPALAENAVIADLTRKLASGV